TSKIHRPNIVKEKTEKEISNEEITTSSNLKKKINETQFKINNEQGELHGRGFFQKLARKDEETRLMQVTKHYSRLSGFDKIQFLSRLQYKRFIPESILVYKKLFENNVIARAKYHHHHNLIHLCIQNPGKYEDGIISAWEAMNKLNIEPSNNLLADMIYCASKWKNFELGNLWFEKLRGRMNANDVQIKTYNEILYICATVGGMKNDDSILNAGMKIWQDMIENLPHSEFDFNTYSYSLSIHSMLGNIDELEKLIELEDKNFENIFQWYKIVNQDKVNKNQESKISLEEKLRLKITTNQIQWLSKCKLKNNKLDTEENKKVLKLILKKYTYLIQTPNLEPNLLSFYFIFQFLSKTNNYEVFVKFVKELENFDNLSLTFSFYSQLVLIYFKFGKVDQALNIYEKMKTKFGHLKTFNRAKLTLLKGYSSVGDLQNCLKVFKDIKSSYNDATEKNNKDSSSVLKGSYLTLIDCYKSKGKLYDLSSIVIVVDSWLKKNSL
ncbi:hypothetical protein HK099_002376, partial [Clydaea vesicula]